jgi:hypothetical protein
MDNKIDRLFNEAVVHSLDAHQAGAGERWQPIASPFTAEAPIGAA